MVLISTLGITINMHFCHDQLIDLALYSPAESCCDLSKDAPCDPHEGLSPMDHCDNESITVEALEDFMASAFTFNFENQESADILFWISMQYDNSGNLKHSKPDVPEFYLPPPYQEVDLSQIQSYLI